jgi:ABC-type antimicrobial peptide transport system permease subunit
VLKSVLYGVSAFDPLSTMSAAGLLVATALVAACLPARNATRVEPMQALRNE